MSLITETNQQYYTGVQIFVIPATGTGQEFPATFNTDLVLGSYDPSDVDYALNNFKLYTSPTGLPGTFTEYTSAYTVVNNVIKVTGSLTINNYLVIQLKSLDGGNYGNDDAFGVTVENNYGSYEYIKLGDAVDNFMVGYVGDGKIIQKAKKSDVVFFAKRSLQEFSYDTLKSVKSQELNVPPSLSLALPQDYVNYVRVSRIDELGVKRIIYPANNLTINPYSNPVQDTAGLPVQDNFGQNIEGTSLTEKRWSQANDLIINQTFFNDLDDYAYWANYYGFDNGLFYGQQYGLEPQYAQVNGWFTMNQKEGKISFSSNLANKLIVLEYISDGLAYDLDSRIPKMAEEALYASLLHYIVSTRANQPEYIVQRLRRERSAKLRNAKIRLSNIKLDEITQVMRGKSKWIKH